MHMIEPTKGQTSILVQYIESIGGDKNVFSNHADDEIRRKRNQITKHRWFQALVIQNKQFPRDIPIKFVLAHFSRMVVQNEIPIKGFNLREQVRAFQAYMAKCERELRGKWWQYQNHDERPKMIAASAYVSDEEQKVNDAERSENIKKMYPEGVPDMLKKYITN